MAKNHKERVKALEEAEKKDIVDVAQSLGMGLIKQGNNYLWDEHDSFVFNTRKNLFYWNSRQKGGGAIQLVQIVKECSRPEAIEYLNNMELGTFEAIQETKKAPFHYYMKEHKKIQVSKDYLMNDRKLSKETIQFFISHGVMAQSTFKDKESGHTEPVIVFKHKDLEGNVKGISLQGIWGNHELHGKRGRLKKTYGNGFYGMSVPIGNFNENTPTSETPLRIIAFESPIDLMSYYELYKDTIGDALLVSMNGLRKGTLSTYIANQMGVLIKEEEKPDYLDKLQNLGAKTDKIHISLAVDNDEAGKLFVDGFGIDFLPVQQELPMLLEGKEKSDWNDLLKESKSGKEIPGELKGDINKKMDINADSKDQPITESIEIKKEEQIQKWESLSREAQNEILIVYKENPVNFRLVLSKYGIEDIDNVFTGLNSSISDELVARFNAELREGVHDFNVERKEWLQRFDGFGDTMYIPESLWDTAEKFGLMENYPKIPFDSEETTIAKDAEQVLEMSKNEPQSEKSTQFSDDNADPIVETTKKEENDNSRLSQAKRKLARLENEFFEKSDATMANLIKTQGQPMNIKPEGVRFLKRHAAMEEAVFSKLHEVEAQKERVENLEYQADRKALGLNKQSGLIMSIENLPLIKKEIELSKNGDSMFTKETIKKYEKKVIELEAQKIQVEKGLSNLSSHARSLIDSGTVNQWQKNPSTYFVKGLRKVAFELTPEGNFQQSPRYLATTEEEQVKVDELLGKKEIKRKENSIDNQDSEMKELKNSPEKSTVDNEIIEPTDRFIRVDFNETNPRLGIKDYEGEIVTPELIQEIKALEILIPDTGVYYKFYFDEVVNDEVVKRSRMNVGNRTQENKELYDYLIEGAVTTEIKESVEVEEKGLLDTELVSQYESLPLKEQVSLSEDTLFEGLESADIWQVVEDVKLGKILVDDLEVDTRFLYDFINQTDEEKINVFKQLLTVGSSESDAVSDYFDEKLELKQELEAAKEISQTDPLTEATEKNLEPILITENGWENKMEEQEKNSGLAQLNRSMYLVDFKQAIEDVALEMEKKEEGTSEYLTKAEVEETLDAHLTKVEQIISHFTTSYSLMEDPTDEEKTSLLKGLLDTIAAAVREFKAELIQKLTTKKNTVIYNVQDKTDNLRLSVKNSVNNRILKATEPIKKLVGKIDVKFALEEKVVRPNPNKKQEVTVSSGEEKLVVEELVEAEVVAEKKTEAPKVGEANLVELVREYTKLAEEKKGLSDSIYKAIKNDPLAKLEDIQAKLINNQQLVEDIKEKIIAESPLKSERETKEQEQAAIEKLANLVKQKDQLTAERNQLVEKPDFLRSSLAEKTATTSLGQFKKIDEKIDAIDKEIESIEQGLAPIVEAAAESQVEQVVESVVEPEEIPNPNDPFVLATAAEEKNVTPEAVKENTATTKQEKSFQEIIESKDYKSLTSNLTAGVKDLLNVDSLKNYLDSVDKFHTYSPKNVQLIMKQDPDAVQVASRNKWEKLGYEINPDAKEILVYAPDKNPVLDGQGQPILDEKGKPKTTVDFYLKPVYDVSQTTAGTETLQSDIQIERKEDFSNVYHALVDSSKASTVGIGSIAGNDNGHYNPTDNSITIRQGLGQEQTLKIIIQESAQLALQGNPNEKQGVKDPLLKNFEIESVAYIVSNHVGMDTSNYSFDYLPSLKEKNHQAKEIGKSLDTISKVASGMITEIDKNLVQTKQVSTPKNKFEDRVAKANTENKKLVREAKNQEQTQEVKENSVAKRM